MLQREYAFNADSFRIRVKHHINAYGGDFYAVYFDGEGFRNREMGRHLNFFQGFRHAKALYQGFNRALAA